MLAEIGRSAVTERRITVKRVIEPTPYAIERITAAEMDALQRLGHRVGKAPRLRDQVVDRVHLALDLAHPGGQRLMFGERQPSGIALHRRTPGQMAAVSAGSGSV